MTTEKVVITGLGMLTPCGNTRDATWDSILAGTNGVGSITQFDPSELPVSIAGEVTDFDPKAHLSRVKVKETSRFTQLAIVAAREAVADAQLELTEAERERCGAIIGVGLGGLE
ncbi:MAG: beta-ketoacyl synthase N-terminal-like domain-containing protein, partial [Myxococcota bacterium]